MKESKEKLRLVFERISDELSETDYLDDVLESEGMNPASLTINGLKRIREIQNKSVTLDVQEVLLNIQIKLKNFQHLLSDKTFQKVNQWLPQLPNKELLAVYQKVNDNLFEKDDKDLIQMKVEIYFNDLMDDFKD